MARENEIKSYSDTYLYNKYPNYQKIIFNSIMRDPIIDKGTGMFDDVVYGLKKSRLLSDSLSRILTSTNTILLDPVKPLPKAFRVFCSKDPKDKKNLNKNKIFIDCTGAITKDAKSAEYVVNDVMLISYLMQAAITMAYHSNPTLITRKFNLYNEATICFAKLFTHIIDYLVKVSIQESSKIKVMYVSSMYFLKGILCIDKDDRVAEIATKIAGISDREANMIDYLMDKAAKKNGTSSSDPYDDIKIFIKSLTSALHLNSKVITTDIVVEKWMTQYGPGTVFGLEYFPALSAMLTDAYNGGYINQQKTIEKVCGADMVEYSKSVIEFIDKIV